MSKSTRLTCFLTVRGQCRGPDNGRTGPKNNNNSHHPSIHPGQGNRRLSFFFSLSLSSFLSSQSIGGHRQRDLGIGVYTASITARHHQTLMLMMMMTNRPFTVKSERVQVQVQEGCSCSLRKRKREREESGELQVDMELQLKLELKLQLTLEMESWHLKLSHLAIWAFTWRVFMRLTLAFKRGSECGVYGKMAIELNVLYSTFNLPFAQSHKIKTCQLSPLSAAS